MAWLLVHTSQLVYQFISGTVIGSVNGLSYSALWVYGMVLAHKTQGTMAVHLKGTFIWFTLSYTPS